MFRVFRTEVFEKQVNKLSIQEQRRIARCEKKLGVNPFSGKPLGLEYFREKKIRGRRIYYLIYEEVVIVLMVATSDKKAIKKQQATIYAIKENLEEFSRQITRLSSHDQP